jgi:hypothetical protein
MADGGDVINLKILSPSTEVEGGIHLPDLPASTTIKELRQKIQDAAPSRPATERMRLIYRGRVVANDNDKLIDIFGVESVSLLVTSCQSTTNGSRFAIPRTRACTWCCANSPMPRPPHRPLRDPRPPRQIPSDQRLARRRALCRRIPSARCHKPDPTRNPRLRRRTITTIHTRIITIITTP